MQSKEPKQKRCLLCREPFTPKRIGNTMRMTKHCGNSACELDVAKNNVKQAKPKEKLKKKPKDKPKSKKQKSSAALKKDLWPIFSLHQKLVHSSDGKWCQCYTCEKPLEIGTTNCQGGHCLSKAVYKNLYFDERAVRPQCYYCNINLGGMHYDFCEKLKQEIGVDEFNAMKATGRDTVKRYRDWYIEKIEYYTAEIERLKLLKYAN